MEDNPSSSRVDRKTIEKIRRIQMKDLCNKVYSLLPHQTSKKAISTPDKVEEATKYIKKLQINLEKMKEKKNFLLGIQRSTNVDMDRSKNLGFKNPKIEIQQFGLVLEVVLITCLDSHFLFNETIRVLQEEGVDIVNASYKVNEDSVFHSIHCQVGEFGNEVARISEKLKKFIYS
ncbi:unnamed protein product [Trifolium pratense]|uniref:Uncharacterized protein n=1 Tax=Trifolium pratense TaxID=57577 RepID=A0ACB0JX79_TRIPR|nr:unnamed protein product [Trifolium pratense]